MLEPTKKRPTEIELRFKGPEHKQQEAVNVLREMGFVPVEPSNNCTPWQASFPALEENAAGIILCHNHPSGRLQPSNSDIKLTAKIKEAGEFLDIKVLDHLVVGDEKYYSFADEGCL